MTINLSKELVLGSNPGALSISLKDSIPGKRENKDTQYKFTNIYTM
jgi:hypothetical protein